MWLSQLSRNAASKRARLISSRPRSGSQGHPTLQIARSSTFRIIPEAVAFAKAFFGTGQPMAAICHGPWPVIERGQG
jgi:hypothetical protein